jgi:nicotinamidase-related amidase
MTQSSDLHGNAPDNSRVVLLLVDVINDLEFPGGEILAEHALPAARNIARLKERATRAGVPTIYVNDNFGKWRSDFRTLVSHCIDDDTRGRPIAEILRPQPEDYFVLKPKQSGFYSTTLDLLLKHLGAKTLIIAGFTGDICILFTAIDAHIRDYQLILPGDCIVSENMNENARILSYAARVLDADIRGATDLNLAAAKGRSHSHRAPNSENL